MPKIVLRNSESGKDEDFEPVDAREILAQEGTIYTVPDETREEIGKPYDPTAKGATGEGKINVPQLQGGDAEMQTGLSIEKYGREAVVKAQPGDPKVTPPLVPPPDDMVKADMQMKARAAAFPAGPAPKTALAMGSIAANEEARRQHVDADKRRTPVKAP